jgi:hypothetical protein
MVLTRAIIGRCESPSAFARDARFDGVGGVSLIISIDCMRIRLSADRMMKLRPVPTDIINPLTGQDIQVAAGRTGCAPKSRTGSSASASARKVQGAPPQGMDSARDRQIR